MNNHLLQFTIKFYKTLKSYAKGLFYLLLSGMFFSSCLKDDFEFDKIKSVEWSPLLAAPLVNTSITFSDILSRNSAFQVETDDDNFCTLYLSDTLFTLKASEILAVKDQYVKYLFTMDNNQLAVIGSLGTLSYSDEQHINFKPNDEAELDSLYLKSGKIIVEVQSTFKHNATIQVTIPGLKKNGVVFSKLVTLDYSGNLPVKASLTINLNDYKLDLTNKGTDVNDLSVLYKIKVTGNGNAVGGTDAISFDGTFNNLKFSSAFGYLGQQDLSPALDTIPFNFFNSQPGTGSFTMADPKLKVTMLNSIGVPVYASIPKFEAFNQTNGIYALNSGIPNPLPLYSPAINQIGQSLTGSFVLNKDNSNLGTLISHLPEYFIYQVGMKTNPAGKQGQNFVTDTSRLALLAEIELPLYGSAKDFVITDTADFKIDNIEQIESLLMRTSLTNGFPIDVAVQVYFTDENYLVLDSLIQGNQQILAAAQVDIFSGKVISPTERTTEIAFDQPQLNKIRGAKKVITKGQGATINNGNTHVKIYADYALGLRIGAKLKVKVVP